MLIYERFYTLYKALHGAKNISILQFRFLRNNYNFLRSFNSFLATKAILSRPGYNQRHVAVGTVFDRDACGSYRPTRVSVRQNDPLYFKYRPQSSSSGAILAGHHTADFLILYYLCKSVL